MNYSNSKEYCPHCGFDLQGDAIPEKSQHLFNATHFSKKIGIYDCETDRTFCYMCPSCDGTWLR